MQHHPWEWIDEAQVSLIENSVLEMSCFVLQSILMLKLSSIVSCAIACRILTSRLARAFSCA